ncbi:hypothetical protein [Desulfoplanes sp.]
MHAAGIHSVPEASTSTTLNVGTGAAKKQPGTELPPDTVDLRSSRNRFEDMDPDTAQWDSSIMDATIGMVRGGHGFPSHAGLDAGRVAGLISGSGVGLA